MQEGIRPSPSLYAALLHLCSKTHDAKYALEIVREMKQNVRCKVSNHKMVNYLLILPFYREFLLMTSSIKPI